MKKPVELVEVGHGQHDKPTIRDAVIKNFHRDVERRIAGKALDLAAEVLRDVGSGGFDNAARELSGAVLVKAEA